MSLEVSKGWSRTTIAQVADINIDNLSSNTSLDYQLNYIDVATIVGPSIMLEPHSVVFGEAPSRARRKVRSGDILVSTIRPYLRSFYKVMSKDPTLVASTAFAVVRPQPTVDGDFLYQHILWCHFTEHLTLRMKGSNYPAVTATDVGEYSFLLPSLSEQRRIAEILSSVDDAIAATQAVIEQTKKVKQATLERLLTKGIGHTRFKQTEVGDIPDSWDVATIESYLARLIDYRGVPPPKAETGIPLITAKNVRMGYLNPEPREYIREADFNDWMRRGIPEAGDVLFTTEAPLGYVAQVPNYQIALGQRTITLCPDRKRLNPSFLTWLLLSSASQLRIMERATGSTALGIKQATFRKILFPFPPLDEQRKIAFYMDEIAKTEELENRKLTGLIAIKSALMSDLLTGRKRVTDTLPLAAE
ncbi:restriction endonuclease subunit S [Ochrobactrum quorumnocens]|uniref:Type I restriction modification DNA specificity domain-containing protein n=1 Tax=Ochrobactrum quorumnocens TaxID=271865 RepID=A0A5N1JPL9_9HYPH|nr:restriction endonuclease subunit S [[Ochrobactrum] quorumnocens]KAA9366142.1 hypothetical protein F3W84_17970 [[Ochrobactrum] quorumnocens]